MTLMRNTTPLAPYSTDSRAGSVRARRSERGQGILEFVLVMPLLLLFIFVIVDFGIGINRRVIVTNAAREAARYGATGQTIAAIKQRAVDQSKGLFATSDVDVTFYDTDSNPGLNPGDSVAVHITYSYKFLEPFKAFDALFPTSLEMNACTDMRMEQVPTGATAQPAGTSPCAS